MHMHTHMGHKHTFMFTTHTHTHTHPHLLRSSCPGWLRTLVTSSLIIPNQRAHTHPHTHARTHTHTYLYKPESLASWLVERLGDVITHSSNHGVHVAGDGHVTSAGEEAQVPVERLVRETRGGGVRTRVEHQVPADRNRTLQVEHKK